MILFIFEGDEREPSVYQTLDKLYFPRGNDNIICSYGNNIYSLYNDIMEYEGSGDIVAILKERLINKGDSLLKNIRRTDISEIFLFFDYDFHHSQLSIGGINKRVEKMLNLFDDETSNGKLYINYPMIESIRYTKELPDLNYCDYVVSRSESHDFKRLTHEFSFYRSYDHILFRKDEDKPTKERYLSVKDSWKFLIRMNVCKANWLIFDSFSMPLSKQDINQLDVFRGQRDKFVEPSDSVAVLNSFPIFLYEYLKRIN